MVHDMEEADNEAIDVYIAVHQPNGNPGFSAIGVAGVVGDKVYAHGRVADSGRSVTNFHAAWEAIAFALEKGRGRRLRICTYLQALEGREARPQESASGSTYEQIHDEARAELARTNSTIVWVRKSDAPVALHEAKRAASEVVK